MGEVVDGNVPHFIEIIEPCPFLTDNPPVGCILKVPGNLARQLCQWASPPRARLADEFMAKLGEVAPKQYVHPEDVKAIRRNRAKWIAAHTPPDPVLVAYTIGTTAVYDECLADSAATGKPLLKNGRLNEAGEPNIGQEGYAYGGGIAWLTAEAALAYLAAPEWREQFPDDDPDRYSVYRLSLVDDWSSVVREGEDGQHYLERTAIIMGKYEPGETEENVSGNGKQEEEETVETVYDVGEGVPEDVARALGIDPAIPGAEETVVTDAKGQHRMMESPTKETKQ